MRCIVFWSHAVIYSLTGDHNRSNSTPTVQLFLNWMPDLSVKILYFIINSCILCVIYVISTIFEINVHMCMCLISLERQTNCNNRLVSWQWIGIPVGRYPCWYDEVMISR